MGSNEERNMKADEAVIDAMFDMGFGKEHVDALLDLCLMSISKTDAMADVTMRKINSRR